jgi:hypothetical protein
MPCKASAGPSLVREGGFWHAFFANLAWIPRENRPRQPVVAGRSAVEPLRRASGAGREPAASLHEKADRLAGAELGGALR